MLSKNPTEELAFYLMRDKRNSFHFGEISLGVKKLLEAVKEKGYIVYYQPERMEPKLLSKEECARLGIVFEHTVIAGGKLM
jgi:hypothetical protein